MNNKKHSKKFSNYLIFFLVIVTVLLCVLIYSIKILPNDFFIFLSILVVIIDSVLIALLKSSKVFSNIIGTVLSIITIVLTILGITYEMNTIDFFRQFGFNSYKMENYNVVVLKDSNYEKIDDLRDLKIGHLDQETHEGLAKALEKLNGKINTDSVILEDISSMTSNLLNSKVSAIMLEDSQLEIVHEENSDIYDELKIIDNYEIKIKLADLGKAVDVTKDPYNIYISGIDTYGSINKVSRSDVNIVVTVNPSTNKIMLTSIPRDYYVTLRGFNAKDKLTHAGIYGIETSLGTIEDLLDTKINYYYKVNFTTLIKVVDALGGITVDSKYSFTSIDGYYYNKGINNLNGEKALSFARERKAFTDGDRVRGENQELILTSIINKTTSSSIINNYNNVLNSLKNQFLTNMTEDEISTIIKRQIEDKTSWNVESISLNGTDSTNTTYSYKNSKLYVMEPDLESVNEAKNKINNILLGKSLIDN